MRLVLLGTGTPNAEPDRSGPALAVVVDERAHLVDCGPGVVRQAAKAHQRGINELAPDKLDRVFITHLHSDHTAGYPDLILAPAVLGRPGALDAYGPPGLAAMSDHLLAAYADDIRERVAGLESGNPHAYKVNVREIEPGVIYSDDSVCVTAFAVQHGTWPHAFGFRFDTPDRVIVISGDTVPSAELVRHAKGCDILVHEVYSAAGFARRPPQWQRYHASAHTSTHQLAQLAAEIRPRLLILTHQLLWGASEEDLLAEIREHYDGDVRSGRDLDVY